MPVELKTTEATLRQIFGFDGFLAGQKEIIEDILSGRPTIVVRPTGGGKSLCYQLPALQMVGMTIVVCPLIALMNDQVDYLRSLGIRAAYLNSGQSQRDRCQVEREIQNGEVKILYVAPERFGSARFQRLISQQEISLLAVDEAHCISQWGHDFRPDYRQLKVVIEVLKPFAIVACTATATKRVIDDIAESLALEDPICHGSGFRRDNLYLSVMSVKDESHRDQSLLTILEGQTHFDGKTIIYANTRKTAERIGLLIETELSSATPLVYHAGLSEQQRDERQTRFSEGNANIMVATNAFGLGINLPDIRLVIHVETPRSIARYYQEVGRAGRDGQPAGAILLFRAKDIGLHRFMIELNHPLRTETNLLYTFIRKGEGTGVTYLGMERFARVQRIKNWEICIRLLRQNGLLYENQYGSLCSYQAAPKRLDDVAIDWSRIEAQKRDALSQLDAMRSLAMNEHCLHETVREHFDQAQAPQACPGCSACDHAASDTKMFKQIDERILNCVRVHSGKYDLLGCAKHLAGRKIDATSVIDSADSLYFLPLSAIQQRIQHLIQMDFLQFEGDDAKRLRLGFQVNLNQETTSVDSSPYREALELLRERLGQENKRAPRQIIPNPIMERLVFSKPRTKMAFLEIAGLGQTRWEQFGRACIEIFKSLPPKSNGDSNLNSITKEASDEQRTISN